MGRKFCKIGTKNRHISHLSTASADSKKAQLWSKVCYLTKPVGPVDKRKKEEIDGCRDAFLAFETDRSGTIDLWELRQVLEVAFFLMYHIIFVALFFVTIFFF